MTATAKLPSRRPRARTLRLAVLMGGVSSEREVSLRSGQAVARALEKVGHDVLPVVVESDGPDALEALVGRFDACFIALHGRFGEDGGVQRMLDARGIPYVGSGADASAKAFDKAWTKAILRAEGIPVARDLILRSPFTPRDVVSAIRNAPFADRASGPRIVVKPVREGSSVGISLCRTPVEAARAAWRARSFEQPLLLEEFIPGRELTVAILGDRALPPIEVCPAVEFYDYKAKYDPTMGTRYRVNPDDIDPALREKVKQVALDAHRALGCEDVSRVDVRLDPEGRPFVLEVNTLPGCTATSLLPKAAAAENVSFEDMCDRLVRRALARWKGQAA